MRLFNNPARQSLQSAGGTHGGEYIACKKFHKITHIDQDVYDSIQEYSQEHLCFAACILRLKGRSIILVALYLWSGQGMSDANFRIFKQLRFLKDAVGKPLLVFGDMNMTSEQIAESGIFGLLGLDMIILKPSNVTSTMHKIPNRVIDLVMVEPCIAHIVHDLKADVSTPFLHLGLEAKISARPKAEQILVLVSPKPLPHEKALESMSP